MIQTLFWLMIGFILFEFILSQVLDWLNLKSWDQPLAAEVKDLMSPEEYGKAKAYAEAHTHFGTFYSTLSTLVLLVFFSVHGFAQVDQWVSGVSDSPILRALFFFGILGGVSQVLSLPFRIYSTFVIEQKFGFNKMTFGLFVSDFIKSLVLSILLGGGLLALLTYLYGVLGNHFWMVGWAVTSLVTIFLAMFYTSLFLPLFNKLSPLENGELRQSIERFAAKVQFPLTNIFIMDGSKRSTKANAFFSGLGPQKNIVLFDNLVKDLNTEEVTAVLAHEVGHYQMKHVLRGMILSVLQMGLLFFIFGWLAEFSGLGEVLGAAQNSFHISLVVFLFLYSPMSLLIRLMMRVFSRKYEYEADAYASSTDSAVHLINALKKLSKNHLSHLQPHPAYVFFNYSHPTLLQRMRRLHS